MRYLPLIFIMVFLMSPAMTMLYLWILEGRVFNLWQVSIGVTLFAWAWCVKLN